MTCKTICPDPPDPDMVEKRKAIAIKAWKILHEIEQMAESLWDSFETEFVEFYRIEEIEKTAMEDAFNL